jgi:hypothetical protein
VSGRQVWKRDQLGVSYNANYSQYGQGNLGGSNNSLNLDYSRLVSRRITLQVAESLQDLSQNYTLTNPTIPATSVADIDLASSPNVQLLNSTTRQSSSQASVMFRQTSRLSYSVSADYFIVGHTQGTGMTGKQFGANLNYRLTRKASIGAYYSHTMYEYSHNISSSDSDGIGMSYSYTLNRTTQLNTRFGVSRIESLAYETVPLPPYLAVLLGQGATIINAYNRQVTSDISVQLRKDLRRSGVLSFAYAHGESPGNGVLLTSIQQTVSATYSMGFLRRRLPLNIGANYSTLSATAQTNQDNSRSEGFTASTSRPLRSGATATFAFNYQRYLIDRISLPSQNLGISIGISWGAPIGALLRRL